MNILLDEIVLWTASILPQEVFMSGSFPQIVQSQAKEVGVEPTFHLRIELNPTGPGTPNLDKINALLQEVSRELKLG